MNSTIALMYDFDKTLCTKDMQEYSFIPKIRLTSEEFWEASNGLAKREKMDKILAYMLTMLSKATAADQSIRREDFVNLGRELEFFPGVETWFDRINQLAEETGVEIVHYIISSGLKEIIRKFQVQVGHRAVSECGVSRLVAMMCI